MTDTPDTDTRIARLVTRVDLLAGEIADARHEIVDLQGSREVHAGQLAALERQDARVLIEVGGLRAEVGVLAGAVAALGTRLGAIQATLSSVPRGAVIAAGAGAGVPSALVLAWQVAQAMGWVAR